MELQFDNIVSITTGNLSDERNEEAYEYKEWGKWTRYKVFYRVF